MNWGLLLLVGLVLLIFWAAKFGNDLGRDIARCQISKRQQLEDLEKRLAKLEREKPRT